MPEFDLRYIHIAKYQNNNGSITYSDKTSIGDAMSVNLSVRRAEGRLYAESSLAEYLSKIIGGTISIAEKYIPDAAQKLAFGARESTRTVNNKQVTGLKYGSKDKGSTLGVAFFAPDMIDGEEKCTCVLVNRTRLGLPDKVFQTMGESITFQTPTCSGEFMPAHNGEKDFLEVAVVDDEADAMAWVDAVLST